MADTQGPEIYTADGTPLRVSLKRALRRQKFQGLMLVGPLLIFILITFVIPIGDMLFRSVENSIVTNILPRSTKLLENWDASTNELPSEKIYAAMVVLASA